MAGATLTTTFRFPRNPQNISPLLRLPAELRIKVLRNLLKKSQPIPAQKPRSSSAPDDDDTTNGPRDLNLSSQLLRASQQLYEEGRQVLYKENVLSIEYGPGSPLSCDECQVLGFTLNIPSDPSRLPSTKFSFFDFAKRRPYSLLKMYPALLSFQNIDLTVRSTKKDFVLVICRVMRDFPLGKDVNLIHTVVPWYKLLECCRFLRCRSLHIERPATKWGKTEDQLDEIERLVAGRTRVLDTFLKWQELEKDILSDFPPVRGHIFGGDQRVADSMAKAHEAAERYDAIKFEEHKYNVLEMAKHWMKE
ncbi:hypothetical protein LTR70_001991 [Exophiala xenobiotica]|uniref:Uncharacterized protein n=1 Tax=Lithohypha guttulata TaxID=1690604 RepID=A0ABR0KC25_9EURO|nr:hypothetical protein LTR24_005082 [Lithohypha guttulata]KAK5326227.1 hypothetical protein LTR70_001991 [Exophiala xenobiotica]